MARKHNYALAALSFSLSSGSAEIQLTPTGHFRSADGSGRPHDVDSWFIDAHVAADVISRAGTRKNLSVIDYEHQTLYSEKNGLPAPAAGWFKELEWREGIGLFAVNVKWTARAQAAIDADEYLYISPVFVYDKTTGHVIAVRMAALTNDPGLEGMSSVALTAAFAAFDDFQQEEDSMNETLKKLLAALGLPEATAEADAISAVKALKAKGTASESEVAALKAKVAASENEVVALKAGGAKASPDPAQFVPVSVVKELSEQVAALSGRMANAEVDKMVDEAIAAGKLTAGMADWARDAGRSDIAVLKSFLEKAPAIAALKGLQSDGKDPSGGSQGGSASDSELAVMKALGLTPEEFAKGKEVANV